MLGPTPSFRVLTPSKSLDVLRPRLLSMPQLGRWVSTERRPGSPRRRPPSPAKLSRRLSTVSVLELAISPAPGTAVGGPAAFVSDLDKAAWDELRKMSFEEVTAMLQSRPAGVPPRLTGIKPQTAPKLNVLLLVVGTRGDVQPFVALGQALQKHGHRVRLATHAVYRETVVTKGGLEFYPLGGDPAALSAFMVKTGGKLLPSSLTGLSDLVQEAPQKVRMLGEIVRSTWPAATAPDPGAGVDAKPFRAEAIIANPPSWGHVHVAEALEIPCHLMFPQPWLPTTAFPHPLANLRYGAAAGNRSRLNYASYLAIDRLLFEGVKSEVNAWRADTLNLPALRLGEQGPYLTHAAPWSFMWSPALAPKPADWGERIDVVGAFISDRTRTAEQEAELRTTHADLLDYVRESERETGVKPIFVGFGSCVIPDPASLSKTILAAAVQAKCRVVLQSSWSKMDASSSAGTSSDDAAKERHVFHLGRCPHDWLFEHVAAGVNHGGAGTVTATLRAGKPCCVVPFCGDQFFWGMAVEESGCGPAPLPFVDMTVAALASRFQRLTDPKSGHAHASQTMAKAMHQENGVATAMASFHRHILPLLRRTERGHDVQGDAHAGAGDAVFKPSVDWVESGGEVARFLDGLYTQQLACYADEAKAKTKTKKDDDDKEEDKETLHEALIFNANLDEPFDVGRGACKKHKKRDVFAAHLVQVQHLLRRHGRRMMCFSDFIGDDPKVLDLVPRDVILMEWGYDAGHPFDVRCGRFAARGQPFYVVPGTSSWSSFTGRTHNTLVNCIEAAEAAAKHKAAGYMVADWGDWGHWQPPCVSLLGFLSAACCAWRAHDASSLLRVEPATAAFAAQTLAEAAAHHGPRSGSVVVTGSTSAAAAAAARGERRSRLESAPPRLADAGTNAHALIHNANAAAAKAAQAAKAAAAKASPAPAPAPARFDAVPEGEEKNEGGEGGDKEAALELRLAPLDVSKALSLHVLRDFSPGAVLGRAMHDLGNTYAVAGLVIPNGSVLFWSVILVESLTDNHLVEFGCKMFLGFHPRRTLRVAGYLFGGIAGRMAGLDAKKFLRAAEYAQAVLRRVDAWEEGQQQKEKEKGGDDNDNASLMLLLREVRFSAALAIFAARLWAARLRAGVHLPVRKLKAVVRAGMEKEWRRIMQEHVELFVLRSRPGGLKKSMEHMTRLHDALRGLKMKKKSNTSTAKGGGVMKKRASAGEAPREDLQFDGEKEKGGGEERPRAETARF